jgi:hypothetical protein
MNGPFKGRTTMKNATAGGREAVDIDRVVWDPDYRQRVITDLNRRPRRRGRGTPVAPHPKRGLATAGSASTLSPSEDPASRA